MTSKTRTRTSPFAAVGLAVAMAATMLAATPVASAEGIPGWSQLSRDCQRGALVGALGGGLLGGLLSKDKNRLENGAMAAAGGAVAGCLLARQFGPSDNERMARLQHRAITTGNPVSDRWRNHEGRIVNAHAVPFETGRFCRRATVRYTVDGFDQSRFTGDRFCQDRRGNWVAA
jgi:surface antigen